jgi:hypothetical protein
MRTSVADSSGMVGSAVPRRLMVREVLLACGILSSLLYVGMDIFASMQWEGYSYISQAFSELTALEAPTRPLMVLGNTIPYSLLVIAFAVGVWESAGPKRSLRIVAGMLAAYSVAGIIGGIIFPMHSRGQATMTLTDTLHIVATTAGVLAMLLFIGFGAAAFGKWFRIYSIGTILLLILGGTLAGLDGSRMAAGLPTPWMGVTERANIYACMLWVVVLVVALLCAPVERLQDGPGASADSQGSDRLRREDRERIGHSEATTNPV